VIVGFFGSESATTVSAVSEASWGGHVEHTIGRVRYACADLWLWLASREDVLVSFRALLPSVKVVLRHVCPSEWLESFRIHFQQQFRIVHER